MSEPIPPIAAKLGTVNLLDRSRQYTRTDTGELLRSLNQAWTKIRLVEQESRKKDLAIHELHQRIASYRAGMIALTSVITGLCWEGVRFLAPIVARYLGLA